MIVVWTGFKAEIERRSGVTLWPGPSLFVHDIQDPFGWHACADGSWFYGLHILSGRIRDADGWPMKSALREIAGIHEGDFRLTPSQNLTISGVTDQKKPLIDSILARHGLASENVRSGLRLNALSCVACRPAVWRWRKVSGRFRSFSNALRPFWSNWA
jgi:sulfite reductase (NADPH) hemoprotein beta-component